MVTDKTVLEKLAALEHNQWMEWANSIWTTENISSERRERWDRYFCAYEDLPEDIKERDRVWARKVLEVINNS